MDLEDYCGKLVGEKMKETKMMVEFGWKEGERMER